MTESITNGLFLLAATLIGGLISNLATRTQAKISALEEENNHMRKRLKKMLHQIEAYHFLEDLYANKLADANKKAVTIKTEYRDKVVQDHQCERPHLTAKEAAKQIHDI